MGMRFRALDWTNDEREAFMWKVRRREGRDRIVLSLSGHVRSEHVNELRQVFVLEEARQDLILDLKDLKLVDQDAVNFLADCETGGATLRNCPAYIREWIDAERQSNESTLTEG